jgi:hypothetical protein
MNENDREALKASFRGVRSTAARLQQLESTLESASLDSPPTELIRAATAHAIAAGAFSGLLHRLFTPGGAPPAGERVELTDSAGESAT